MALASPKLAPRNLLIALPREVSAKLPGGKSVTLREGDILFERGDPGDGCYWVRSGALAAFVTSARGEKRTLAMLGPDAIVGDLAMIDGLPRSASVIAVRNSVLTFVSRAAFGDMLRRHPELSMEMLATLAARLRRADEEIAAACFLTVRARVARALLQFVQLFGEEAAPGRVQIQRRVTQGDLAALAGVARESVNRTLRDWHREKLLTGSSQAGFVVNRRRLEDEAEAGN